MRYAIRSTAMHLMSRIFFFSAVIFCLLGISTKTFSSPLQNKNQVKIRPLNSTQLYESEIRKFTSEQIRSLPPETIQALSPEQIRTLKKSHINSLARNGSCASLRHFTQEQIRALGKNLKGLGSLSPPEQLKAFSPEQYEWLSSIQRRFLPPLIHNFYRHLIGSKNSDWKLAHDEIRKISPERMTGKHFEMRDLFINIAHFTNEQIEAIAPFYMLVFWSLPLLSPDQIRALTRDQINYLSAEQLNLLSRNQVQSLTPEQRKIINLNLNQVRLLKNPFIEALFPEITLEQIQKLLPYQIAQLGEADIDEGNLKMKLVLVFITQLNKEQLRSISPIQMNLLDPQNIQSLKEEQVKHLLPEQIENIYPSTFLAFKPSQITAMHEEQISAIHSDQMRGLSYNPESVAAILPVQVRFFSPTMIKDLNTHRIADFLAPSIIKYLLPTQLSVLDSNQIKTLSYYLDRADALREHSSILTLVQQKALNWNSTKQESRQERIKWALKPRTLSGSF